MGGKTPWAQMVRKLRERLALDQAAFGQRLHSSAMAVSRWERGAQEPPPRAYIELGNLAGDPDCWYFWGRAGLRGEDVMRVMPQLERRLHQAARIDFEIVSAGSGPKKTAPGKLQLVAIPLLKMTTAMPGEKADAPPILHATPVESVIAAPTSWCPNPTYTSCLRVQGNSMAPMICDGYIIAVDSSQNDHAELNGKIVIAWNKDKGLTVSRFRCFDHTEVLQPENAQYESITLSKTHAWKVLAKVLWWIGKAP